MIRAPRPRVRSTERGNLAEIWEVWCMEILYGSRRP